MDGTGYQTKYEVLTDSTVNPYGSLLNTQNARTDMSSDGSSSGVMMHTAANSSRRWNHITDLDSFFKRIYRYHQSGGFLCIVCREILDILKFASIVFITFMVLCGINFSVYFGNESVVMNGTEVHQTTISDGLYTMSEAVSNVTSPIGIVVLVALLFFLGKFIYVFHNIVLYWETKDFINNALGVADFNLQDCTWDEIKRKVMEVQTREHMCIQKEHLTPLDIYQRILRHINFLIALINQNVIPVKFRVPFLGEVVHFSKGYEINLYFLFFWGGHSLLQSLNFDKLRSSDVRRNETKELKKKIIILAILNFIFMPFIFIYQFLYAIYHYAERIKNEPGKFGGRIWSNYGKLYVRHYNELEHELTARLNIAHKPASSYLGSFTSPLLALSAGFVDYICKAIACIIIVAGIYDDGIFRVQHIFSILGVLLILISVCSALIPDENMAFIPEILMQRIVNHIHYMPEAWHGRVHTRHVRDEFAQFFQYKFSLILEDMISPLVTPIILLYNVLPQSKRIIDFFYMFTVEVDGIGHVCSFAQMDVNKHGTPSWQTQDADECEEDESLPPPSLINDNLDRGRTEMSLIHFTNINPDWNPSKSGAKFLLDIKRKALLEGVHLNSVTEEQIHYDSIDSSVPYTRHSQWNQPEMSGYRLRGINGNVARMVGPMTTSHLSNSVEGNMQMSGSLRSQEFPEGVIDLQQSESSLNMNKSIKYIRDLNLQKRFGCEDETTRSSRSQERIRARSYQRSPSPPTLNPDHEAQISRMDSPSVIFASSRPQAAGYQQHQAAVLPAGASQQHGAAAGYQQQQAAFLPADFFQPQAAPQGESSPSSPDTPLINHPYR